MDSDSSNTIAPRILKCVEWKDNHVREENDVINGLNSREVVKANTVTINNLPLLFALLENINILSSKKHSGPHVVHRRPPPRSCAPQPLGERQHQHAASPQPSSC